MLWDLFDTPGWGGPRRPFGDFGPRGGLRTPVYGGSGEIKIFLKTEGKFILNFLLDLPGFTYCLLFAVVQVLPCLGCQMTEAFLVLGLPREPVGTEKFGMPLKPMESKLFGGRNWGKSAKKGKRVGCGSV